MEWNGMKNGVKQRMLSKVIWNEKHKTLDIYKVYGNTTQHVDWDSNERRQRTHVKRKPKRLFVVVSFKMILKIPLCENRFRNSSGVCSFYFPVVKNCFDNPGDTLSFCYNARTTTHAQKTHSRTHARTHTHEQLSLYS